MSAYIRLKLTFWTHRKTLKLVSLIGKDAFWVMPRLWSYAAEHQPDGDFSKYSPEDIAKVVDYTNADPETLWKSIHESGYAEKGHLHDWREHNGIFAFYHERAKAAAFARWSKIPDRSGVDEGDVLKLYEECYRAFPNLPPPVRVNQPLWNNCIRLATDKRTVEQLAVIGEWVRVSKNRWTPNSPSEMANPAKFEQWIGMAQKWNAKRDDGPEITEEWKLRQIIEAKKKLLETTIRTKPFGNSDEALRELTQWKLSPLGMQEKKLREEIHALEKGRAS